MPLFNTAAGAYDGALRSIAPLDGIAPLLLRLIHAPVMMQAGWNKLVGFEGTVYWFGNSLGMPFPELMAALAMSAELGGGALLLIGLGTRIVAIPLMVTMLVAALAVHWDNGWLVLSDSSSWLANDRVMEAQGRGHCHPARARRLPLAHGARQHHYPQQRHRVRRDVLRDAPVAALYRRRQVHQRGRCDRSLVGGAKLRPAHPTVGSNGDGAPGRDAERPGPAPRTA